MSNYPERNTNNNSRQAAQEQDTPEIVYSYAKKGYRYDLEGKYAQSGENLDEFGNPTKPGSSNTPVVVFDTGNTYVKGKCYDHHQLTQAAKLRYPSATAMVFNARKEIYEAHKDDKRVRFVCHDHPDNDAILSISLASMIMECKGQLPIGSDELLRVANESDTFSFKPGFNFGTLLAKYITTTYEDKRNNNRTFKINAIEECVAMVKEMTRLYGIRVSQIKDPEERKKYTLDSFITEYSTPGTKLYCYDVENSRIIRKMRDEIIQQDKKDEVNFNECLKNKVSLKNRDTQNKDTLDRDFVVPQESLSSDTFEVPLCKRQITNEETKKPLEKSDEKCSVFVYTGSKKPSAGVAARAAQKYDVTIFPKYDLEKGEVTYKIATTNPNVDLGHFGRYIETLIFRENLNKDDSTIQDPKEFKKQRQEFIESIKPLTGSQENKHFTGYDSICGNDPTFFGFKVDKTSNLFSLQNLKGYMTDYFENPKKIKNKDFVNMIGEENIDEIDKLKRPEVYAERQERKAQLEEIKMAEQVADLIVESGLNDKEASQVIEEMVDTNIEEAAYAPAQESNELGD